ncbi:TetR/AcrR family transcriptional regulator [Kribbella sp. DT2]|uniref:TetR/AcrR family transcriptional regulator n=1 Tax=Kribbella sp. DT2 TaxID=3393427 RepID=UPI003CF11F02
MGNREALIEGAKTCLREKGYTRTTARDIATAAGVSLAAIGYHFGSKDALLNEAMRQALGEWGDELARTMSADPADDRERRAGVPGDGAPEDGEERGGSQRAGAAEERFVAIWALVGDSLSNPASRALWTTQFEILSQGSQLPDLLQAVSAMQVEAREGLATLFGAFDAEPTGDAASASKSGADEATAQQTGSFLQALLLGVVALTMFDPERAPSGEDLSASIQLMAAKLAR